MCIVGFQVTLRQYCDRIRNLFSELCSLYNSLIPGNAGVFSAVITFRIVESVIARVHTIDADDKEDEYQNSSFQAYAEDIEDKLEKRLERLNYLIDDRNTLSLVTGPGRLEEVCGNLSPANFISWSVVFFPSGLSPPSQLFTYRHEGTNTASPVHRF
jgi:hypothetical protein